MQCKTVTSPFVSTSIFVFFILIAGILTLTILIYFDILDIQYIAGPMGPAGPQGEPGQGGTGVRNTYLTVSKSMFM